MEHKAKEGAEALVGAEKINASKLLRLLQKKGDLKKIKETVRLAEKFILAKSGNKKVIIETARKTDNQALIKKIAKKGDVVVEKINPYLIAGVRIIVNDEKQLDFSISNTLNSIF